MRVETLQERAEMFLTFYKKFIMMTIFTYIVIFVSTIIEEVNCYYYNNSNGDLHFSITLHNVVKLITPLLQCVVIILYYKFNVYAENEGRNKNLSIEMQKAKRSESIVGSITSEVKTITLYSIISGILLLFHGENNESIISTQYDQENLIKSETIAQGVEYFSEADSVQVNELTFDEEMVKKTLECHVKEQPVFQMKLVSHAHPIFQYFQKQDHADIDFHDSLSLQKNLTKMQELAGPSSGKSGEFFFFTHDHKLILKTIKNSELISFKKIFKNYGNYLYNHPDSYLARIYGVLTFNSMGQSNAIIIMKNITMGLPRHYILKQFDLKGSEYDREVLNKQPNADLSKTVLKDLDFFKTEHKIWIDDQHALALKAQLLKDAHFLQ